MRGITVDQVRAADVADLATSLLGLADGELLGVDGQSAEALVAAAQRVISAVTAVRVVAIEAWGRREGEQLRIDKAQWAGLVLAEGTNPGGINAARRRLQDGVPTDEGDFMGSYLAPVLRLWPRSAARRYESARVLVGLLPATLSAMRAGDLEPHRAQQVVNEVPTDNPLVCGLVEAVLFPTIVDTASTRVGQLARKAVVAADPAAVARKAEQAQQGRFVFAGPSGLPGLMRLEAEVESGKGAQVWAAVQELAATYLKENVAATMGQARADALVDLVLANVSVSTVVDLALPAGFATGAPAPAGSCPSCGRGPASEGDQIASGGLRAGLRAGGSVLEDHATGVLVDVDQDGAGPASQGGAGADRWASGG